MEKNYVEVRVKGKTTRVPASQIDGRTVIVQGSWMRIARVHDEDWQTGHGDAVLIEVNLSALILRTVSHQAHSHGRLIAAHIYIVLTHCKRPTKLAGQSG